VVISVKVSTVYCYLSHWTLRLRWSCKVAWDFFAYDDGISRGRARRFAGRQGGLRFARSEDKGRAGGAVHAFGLRL
jgi:hypothetical protein